MSDIQCKSREDILNQGGEIIHNTDGTLSVFVLSQVTSKLVPYPLTKPCCERLVANTPMDKNIYFDTNTQKCRWSNNGSTCNFAMPFNLVLNPKGNDGVIFSEVADEKCTLGIEFDYMFKFDCDKLNDFIDGRAKTTCTTLPEIFENLGASMTIDIVKSNQGFVRHITVYEEKFFTPIGSGKLEDYLISNSGTSGFYVCSEVNSDTNCSDLDLYDDYIVRRSNCFKFVEQILTSLTNVPSNSFASNWLHFNTTITDETILSAITNEKIKLTIKVSGSCIDNCVLLDNIKLNKNCTKVTRSDIFLTKSPSFELDRIIDNKKSWLGNTETTHRTFNITKVDGSLPIRHTDYYLDDERQIINTKEIDLDINIASAVETDVWCYISDNPCILTGNTIGTTTCVKDALSFFSGATVFTAITSQTQVVTGITANTVVTSVTTTYTAATFTCPYGYSATTNNGQCESVIVVSAIQGTPGATITHGSTNLAYGNNGAYFYPQISLNQTNYPFKYNSSGNLIDGNGSVITQVNVNNSATFWGNPSMNTTDGRLNKIGLTANYGTLNSDGTYDNWAGFSKCLNVTVAGTYYVALAADNLCRFSINGTLIADFDKPYTVNFNKWSVFPIYLNTGKYNIEMEGVNVGAASAFGAEVYFPSSYAVLTGATSTGVTQANAIFSTLNFVGQQWNTGSNGYSCPSSPNGQPYSLDTCITGATPVCTQISQVPIISGTSYSSATTTGTTIISSTTYTQTVLTGFSYTNGSTGTTICQPKTYCCSEYCGDAEIDINRLLTQPLSGVTTIEDFKYYITSELIDVKTRQTLSSYPTLRLLYERYVNSLNFCSTKSSAFNYSTMNSFANLIGDYWVDLIEQVIPATTIWGSTKVYRNTIFDTQKFKYRPYTLLLGADIYTNIQALSPVSGNTSGTTNVGISATSVYPSQSNVTSYTNAFVKQFNQGSDFFGTVKIVSATECALLLTTTSISPNYKSGNGSITVNVTNTTGPFTYSWSNGATTKTISNLSAGTYSVTVTNVRGCTGSISVTLMEIPPEEMKINVSGTTGFSISVVTSSSPYYVDWGDGNETLYSSGNTNPSHTYSSAYTGNVSFKAIDLTPITVLDTTNGSGSIMLKTSELIHLDNLARINLINVSGVTTEFPRSMTTIRLNSAHISGNVSGLPSGLTFCIIQANNTVSGDVAGLPSGITTLSLLGNNTVSGDVAGLPDGLISCDIRGSNTISGNISGIPTGLTTVLIQGNNTLSGDTSNFFSGVTSINITGVNTISGDVAGLPDGLISCDIRGSNLMSGDTAGLPSGMTSVNIQGSNTISGNIGDIPSGITSFTVYGINTIGGDVAGLPLSINNLDLRGNNSISGDTAGLPSSITGLLVQGYNTISGDIAGLPLSLVYIVINGNNLIDNYTSGKIWPTTMQMVEILSNNGMVGLDSTEVDNLLIDLATYSTIWTNTKIIKVRGTRTAASDAAVTTLNSRGVTITLI